MVSGAVVAPCCSVTDEGETVTVKFGAGPDATVRERFAELERVPLEPMMTTRAVPGVAELLAVKVICCDAELCSVKGEGGLDVTPAGSPVMVVFTLPLNPFCDWILSVTAAVVAPRWTVIEEADSTKAKEGGGADEPPLQPERQVKRTR